MRFLFFVVLVLPTISLADIIPVRSQPQSVTIHPEVAIVSRSVTVAVPAGQHELRLPDLPPDLAPELVTVSTEGATLNARSFKDSPTRDDNWPLTSPELDAARAALRSAQDALGGQNDAISGALAKAAAAQAQVAFLDSLRSEETLNGDAQTLSAIGRIISADGAAARQGAIAAQAEARDLQEELRDLQLAVDRAQAQVTRLESTLENTSELSLFVTAAADSNVAVALEYLTFGARWVPNYRLDLLTGDAPSLNVERSVSISQSTGEDWRNVQLNVSSIRLIDESAPSRPFSRRLRIEDPAELRKRNSTLADLGASSIADPVIEAPVILEEGTPGNKAIFTTAGVVYNFDTPMSVLNGADDISVTLDGLSFDATQYARAVPRFDETAFRMVNFTNTSGESFLATFNTHPFAIDGQLAGTINVPAIEPNEEVELAFGALRGIQLKRVILDREEGDRGLITRTNQQIEDVRIDVENLTGEDWNLVLADSIPYSEQEDLTIDWSARPAPARTNVEDRRGVLEWDLTLAPGSKQSVVLRSEITWPEGKVLR